MARGDSAGALADFGQAIQIEPCYPEAYNNRGAARHAQGDLAGAVADFDRALEIAPDPTDGAFYHNRGAARHALGDFDGAISDYDQSLQLTPPHAAAALYHARGGARHALNNFADAIADYDRALACDPKLVGAYISRGHARYHRRDPRSSTDYQMAFLIDPHAAASEIARSLDEDLRRNAEAVLTNCLRHLRINPNDLMAYARRGLSLLLLGRDEEARADLEVIRARGPGLWPDLERVVEAVRLRRGE
jgi:tetratricopeptide (TPR) repeat protein